MQRGGGWQGEGKEVGWSRLGDRRHHLSQQTNSVCRRDNKVVAAQQQSGFQADWRLDGVGGVGVAVGQRGGGRLRRRRWWWGVQETKLKSVTSLHSHS